jgi:acetyltransferase EpsM
MQVISHSTQPDDGSLPTLVVYGGGGHGKSVIDLVRATGLYQVIGVVDDGLPLGSLILDLPVLGGAEALEELYQQGVRHAANGIGGIGNVDVRLRAFDKMEKAGFTFPPLVHPTAWVEPSATLEPAVQIMPFSYIGPDSRIGFGSLVNIGACVSHDGRLGRVVNLSPGAILAGNVTVKDYAQIGMHATVNLGLNVGERSIIGNGATVIAHVPDNTRVPAGANWPLAHIRSIG